MNTQTNFENVHSTFNGSKPKPKFKIIDNHCGSYMVFLLVHKLNNMTMGHCTACKSNKEKNNNKQNQRSPQTI